VSQERRMVTTSPPTKEMQLATMLELLKESSKVSSLVFPSDKESDSRRDEYSELQLANLWDS